MDAMVAEGTMPIAAGRIGFLPWEQSGLYWKNKGNYVHAVFLASACSSFLFNKLGTQCV